jgi:hypothetical protein
MKSMPEKYMAKGMYLKAFLQTPYFIPFGFLHV